MPLPSPRYTSGTTASSSSSVSPVDSLALQMANITTTSSSASLASSFGGVAFASTVPTSCGGSVRSSRADYKPLGKAGKGKSNESYGGDLDAVEEQSTTTASSPQVVDGPSLLSTTNPRTRFSGPPGADETLAFLAADPPSKPTVPIPPTISPVPIPPNVPEPSLAGHANASTFSVKIADLGNATPIIKHFTNGQTFLFTKYFS